MEISRDRIFKELVIVEKLGNISAEENIEIAKKVTYLTLNNGLKLKMVEKKFYLKRQE